MKGHSAFWLALLLIIVFVGMGATSSTGSPSSPLTVDVVPGTPGCSELAIKGDAPYRLPNGRPSPFSGYADPSLRKDPLSNTLWLAYSWPNQHLAKGSHSPGVDIHLAKSTDGGDSWTFVKNLWPSTPLANPAQPAQHGYLDNETANLLPVSDGNTVTWYAARLNYFVPDTGGYAARPGNSFHLRVFKADSPDKLTNAPYTILGSNLTAPAWGVHQNLQTLDPELSDVDFWNEPALYYEDGTLYLGVVAFVYDRLKRPVMNRHNVYVFATDPSGNPRSWKWTYRGRLAGAAEAKELGAERLTQIDFARGTDGKLLLIATPDDWNTVRQDYNHKGSVALEIRSLSEPSLERDRDGRLKVRAVLTASDRNELGSAAATYDPASSTGIILTKRTKTATQLTVELWRTGVKP